MKNCVVAAQFLLYYGISMDLLSTRETLWLTSLNSGVFMANVVFEDVCIVVLVSWYVTFIQISRLYTYMVVYYVQTHAYRTSCVEENIIIITIFSQNEDNESSEPQQINMWSSPYFSQSESILYGSGSIRRPHIIL